MSQEWFIIKDLEEFINASRRIVFQSFGHKEDDQFEIENMITSISEQDQQELDKTLSYDEEYSIVEPLLKKQTNKKTKKYRLVLNEEMYMFIIEALNNRLVSNILNGLVNKGLIETAYDEESNDFVFWVNNKNIGEDKTDEQQF
jgi:Mg/Co/Ni transporter MgtE